MAASDAGDDSASNASSTNTANVPSQHHKLRHHHHGQQSSGSERHIDKEAEVKSAGSGDAGDDPERYSPRRRQCRSRGSRWAPVITVVTPSPTRAAVGLCLDSPPARAKHPTSGGGGGAFRKGSGAISLGSARNHHHHQKLPRLRNVDRSTARHIPVTANGVTVIITDFKPKTSVASAVAKSKRSVAMESSSNAAATGDHADDSSTSISSPSDAEFAFDFDEFAATVAY
uniref:Kinesin motor domain-containing protein n=1 Tax=Macrostomum lignano TaxID=282301 RepID=A0A1I8JRV0_9PLAT